MAIKISKWEACSKLAFEASLLLFSHAQGNEVTREDLSHQLSMKLKSFTYKMPGTVSGY